MSYAVIVIKSLSVNLNPPTLRNTPEEPELAAYCGTFENQGTLMGSSRDCRATFNHAYMTRRIYVFDLAL